MAPLNPLLKKRLEKLEARNPALTAAIDLVADWDELQELNELARRITEPGDKSGARTWLAASKTVGNVTVHPLSLGGWLWLTELGIPLFEDRVFWQNIAVAYVMAHSRNPEKFRHVNDRESAKRILKEWVRGCGATQAELLDAIDEVCGNDDEIDAEDGGKDTDTNYGPVVALLCREYGATPDYWIWECPLGQLEALVLEYDAKCRREAAAQAKASGGQGAAVAPSPADPLNIAANNLRKAFMRFTKKLEGRTDG